MRVLIVKLSSIGDVVQTIPAAAAMRKGFEKKGVEAEIDWIVEEAASGILKDNPLIDNLFIVKNHGWIKNIWHNVEVARTLAGRRYDIVIDFQGLFKSGVWVLLSRGKRRIGFSSSREGSHIFLTEKLPPYDPERHALDRYLDLARYVAGVGSTEFLPLKVGAEELREVKNLLRRNALSNGEEEFFVMVPRARWKTKLWDDEKFVELGRALYRRFGLHTVIVGGPEEKGLEGIKNGIGTAVNLAGKISLKGLAALARLASFTVSVDSGPMHVLSLHGSKVIALFGPTAPWRTGPYGSGHIVLGRGADCSPCFRNRCLDLRCMKEIKVEDVVDAAEKLLAFEKIVSPGK